AFQVRPTRRLGCRPPKPRPPRRPTGARRSRQTRPRATRSTPGSSRGTELEQVLFSTLEQYNLVFVEDGDGLIRHSRGVVRRDGSPGDLRDVQNRWSTVFGIDSNGAVLIRPDGLLLGALETPAANPHQLCMNALERLSFRTHVERQQGRALRY